MTLKSAYTLKGLLSLCNKMNAKFVCALLFAAKTVLRKSGQVTINMCSLSKLLFIWDYMHEFFRKERISGATNPGGNST